MSYFGWNALRAIENGEARLEHRWWEDHAGRFTSREREVLSQPADAFRRRTVRQGIRFTRPFRPTLRPGWVNVTRNLDAHIAAVKPHQGRWLILVDRLRDFRPPRSGCVRPKRTSERIDVFTTTLVPLEAKRMGEPERMEVAVVGGRLRRADTIREAIHNRG